MQLSPRQYQVDPTGSSYVADTRPLMAAMGAQAATQIEGNRMMQETVQRGMKGVEDFAARRQLAAARVQLGQLKLTDPDYGQKLSGLVMDNPLAFTNEKTAPVANYAFKQAANDFQSKRENEQKMADAYRSYLYQRDVAVSTTGMKLNAQSSAMAKQNAQYAANVYRPQLAAINKSLAEVRKNKSERPKEAKYWERQENELLTQKTDIEGNYKEVLGTVPLEEDYDIGEPVPPPNAIPALPFSPDDVDTAASSSEDFTLARTNANSAGNGAPLPPPGDSGELFLALNPQIQDRGYYGPAPRAEAVPETEVYIPTDSTLTPDVAAPATAPAGTATPTAAAVAAPTTATAVAPTAAPTAAAVAPTATDADAEYMAAEQEVARRLGKEKTTGAAGKMTQSSIDALVRVTPAVNQAQVEYDGIDTQLKILDNQIKDAAEFSADTTKLKADREVLLKNLPAAKNKLELLKAASELKLSEFATAQEALDFLRTEEAIQQDKLKRAETAAAAAAPAAPAASAAGAGGTPPPPPPPMSLLEQAEFDRLKPIKEQEKIAAPESDKQWTDAKNQVIDIVGGPQELMSMAQRAQRGEIPGISDLTRKQILFDVISKKFYADKEKAATLKVFRQKAERLGPQEVTPTAVIAALVDDVLNARIVANKRANAAVATPAPVTPPVSGAKGELIPQ